MIYMWGLADKLTGQVVIWMSILWSGAHWVWRDSDWPSWTGNYPWFACYL